MPSLPKIKFTYLKDPEHFVMTVRTLMNLW